MWGCFSPDSGGDGTNAASDSTSGGASTGDDPSSAGTTGVSADPTTDPTVGEVSGDQDVTSSADPDASGGQDSETGTGATTGQPESCQQGDRVVWINFEGAELVVGIIDNAPFGITSTSQAVGTWSAYADADIDDVFAAVVTHWAPYDVCISLEQPTTADYEMVVVTSTAYMGDPNVIGFVVHDCDDAQMNNVALVFLASENNLPVPTKAIAISNQLATTFGLEGVMDAPDDIMNFIIGTTLNGATFTDACYPLFGMATCDSADACAANEQQSNPQLLEALGPA